MQLLYPDIAKELRDVKCISRNMQTRPPLVAKCKEFVNGSYGFFILYFLKFVYGNVKKYKPLETPIYIQETNK